MIRLDEVTHWAVVAGIGHIVTRVDNGWMTTACDHWMTGDATTERPKRICRACRKALVNLRRPDEDQQAALA